jgi:hypothetical protein
VWPVLIRQFPGPNDEAGVSAINLPELLVLGAVARWQEALRKNGMSIADIFRLYNLIEQAGRQNIGRLSPALTSRVLVMYTPGNKGGNRFRYNNPPRGGSENAGS